MRLRTFITIILLFLSLPLLAGSLTDRLVDAFSAEADEILDPEQAFRIDSQVIDAHKLVISWEIQPGYYLYQDKFAFNEKLAGLKLGTVNIPAGQVIEDPLFGKVMISTGQVEVNVPLERTNLEQQTLELEVAYQGCKKDSVCYPPIKKNLSFVLPAAEAATTGKAMTNITAPVSEQDAIMRRLTEGSLLVNIAVFFGFGLLLSLTPCVFPMIPILSGVIVGQGDRLTTRGAFGLSVVYVLAMASTYSMLGVVAGSFHFNLQAAAQNAWVISAFSLVFVALALSMFGFYEIQLPAGLQHRLHRLSHKHHSGNVPGVAIMGALSAIIVGPCVAPPLAGALLYISQTGNALLGGLALFAMGLGFGVPLLAIGTSAGKILPRAGAWMDTVKAVFGVIMLGVAIWFLERILPGPVTLLLWAGLFMVSAVFMGALDRIESGSGWPRLRKGLGLVILVYAIALVMGAAAGGNNVFQPIPEQLFTHDSESGQRTGPLSFRMITSAADLQHELQQASLQDKNVMLDFYAKWCVDCNEMEAYTFTDPGVKSALGDFVLLQADVTDNDANDQALLKKFNLFGPPAILFFDSEGNEQMAYRLVGFKDADNFIEHINRMTIH